MRERMAKPVVGTAILIIVALLDPCLRAQDVETTLLGKVTDSSGSSGQRKGFG